MPTVTKQKVPGWAHCNDCFCPGNEQQPVEVVRETVQWTYRELGGDAQGFERSDVRFSFADEADVPCKACSKPRVCDEQARPKYPTSQFRADGLLKLLRGEFEAAGMAGSLLATKAKGHAPAGDDDRVADLERQVAEMRELLAVKRGPGRPRKTEPLEGEAA